MYRMCPGPRGKTEKRTISGPAGLGAAKFKLWLCVTLWQRLWPSQPADVSDSGDGHIRSPSPSRPSACTGRGPGRPGWGVTAAEPPAARAAGGVTAGSESGGSESKPGSDDPNVTVTDAVTVLVPCPDYRDRVTVTVAESGHAGPGRVRPPGPAAGPAGHGEPETVTVLSLPG